jgi:hypothetical protein
MGAKVKLLGSFSQGLFSQYMEAVRTGWAELLESHYGQEGNLNKVS